MYELKDLEQKMLVEAMETEDEEERNVLVVNMLPISEQIRKQQETENNIRDSAEKNKTAKVANIIAGASVAAGFGTWLGTLLANGYYDKNGLYPHTAIGKRALECGIKFFDSIFRKK